MEEELWRIGLSILSTLEKLNRLPYVLIIKTGKKANSILGLDL